MSDEFAGLLRERVVIERIMGVRNAMGLREEGWEPFARCLASVIPEGAGAEAEAMSLSAMPRFRVTIRTREGVGIDQRIRWAGRLLMIRQLLDDPRSKDRMVFRCEEVRS